MYYPQVEDNNNTRTVIDTFLGLNRSYRVGNGEFYDMENLSSDGYPILTVRDVRPTLLTFPEEEVEIEDEEGETHNEWRYTGTYQGCVYVGGEFAYLADSVFHYSSYEIDISGLAEINDTQEILVFGNFVLIFPANVWIDLVNRDSGTMGTDYSVAADTTVKYSLCDPNGNDYENITIGVDPPTNPSSGAYWLCTIEGKEGLNIYYNNSWEAVASTYIRIEIPNGHLTSYFAEGDVVFFNSNEMKELNDGVAIEKIDDEYMIVLGILDELVEEITSEAWTLKIERRVPKLDHVCVSKNRVWGCRYGYKENDELINEIYCSKLGDFRNWYSYQGLSTDSYAVTVGAPGDWTGCISYQGYPTFFKEDRMYRVFGNYPSEYQIIEKECRGVQYGSSKSLAILGEYLYYKALGGIMVYDGSTPTMISSAFGRDFYYYDAIAGVSGSKYYVQMANEKNKIYVYVYDSQYGIWTKESQFKEYRVDGSIDSVEVKSFAYSTDGKLFAMTDHAVYGIGQQDVDMYENRVKGGEDSASFMAETGELGFEYPDFKYVSRISVRAYIPFASDLKIEISCDDMPYDTVGKIRGNNNTNTQTVSFYPSRCDHFKLRFSGHGAVRVYNISFTLDTESDEYAYNNR